jgi:hypothetical protein
VEFLKEALYHVAFATPVPLALALVAFRTRSRSVRTLLLLAVIPLFGLIWFVSYLIFCVRCD